jgi:hypothetical protein
LLWQQQQHQTKILEENTLHAPLFDLPIHPFITPQIVTLGTSKTLPNFLAFCFGNNNNNINAPCIIMLDYSTKRANFSRRELKEQM